jgi:nudix-type nucleoside diphosphatase (YffH/AdpP family)
MNPDINIVSNEILSDNWYTLRKIVYDKTKAGGQIERQSREAYDRGNGATILLYNLSNRKVILTRQFRMPTYINGNPDGMLIEACAGLLDKDDPETCIRRETEEETGFQVTHVQKIFEAYMSPGSVTEVLYFFIAEYEKDMKLHDGGGLAEEQEEIEVLELDFDVALAMVANGSIRDAKTIMLLQHLRLQGIL